MDEGRKNRGMAPAAIVLAIVGLVALGAVASWVSKDRGSAMMGTEKTMEEGAMMEDKEAMAESAMMEEKKGMMEGEGAMMEKEARSADAMPAEGAATKKGGAMMEESAMMNSGASSGGMEGGYMGKMIAGDAAAPLLEFTKADYDAAVKSGKLVVLYYYAGWCPICKAEFPKMAAAFDAGFSSDSVVGFRVNYKDDETDADETALAKEHGVSYQHTKVFVRNGERILKAPDSWDTARYASEVNARL